FICLFVLFVPLFLFTHPAPTEIYTLSLHDALPICSPELLPHRKSSLSSALPAGSTQIPDAGNSVPVFLSAFHSEAAPPKSSYSRSEEHTSELQSRFDLVCRLLLEKKNKNIITFRQT